MRRVVVTGLGMVSPLGGNVETTWKNILASKSGAATIARFDASEYKCRIACEVKPADHEYLLRHALEASPDGGKRQEKIETHDSRPSMRLNGTLPPDWDGTASPFSLLPSVKSSPCHH